MNKHDLVKAVAEATGLSPSDAARVVDSVLDAIISTLRAGQDVRLSGFGTFTVTARAARAGRNPRTGESISLPEGRVPKFRSSGTLKAALDGDPTTDP